MSESSDDTFAWTFDSKSSNTSDSSEEMPADNINNTQQSETESERGYKKKLHKKLFQQNEAEVKSELLDEKAVKREQGSDAETARRKRKRKRERNSSPDSSAAPPNTPPDHYLELRVKQERHEYHRQTIDSSVGSFTDHKACNGDDSYDNQKLNESTDSPNHKRKKKKSKKRKEHSESECHNEEFSIEDKFTAEETVVQQRAYEAEQNGDDINMELSRDDKNKTRKSKSGKERRKDLSDSRNGITSDDSKNEICDGNVSTNESLDEHFNRKSIPLKPKNTPKTKKISELIQFEDEIHTNDTYDEPRTDSEYSSQLKRFLKANPHLQTITTNHDCESLITKDDEVWLFNCPHEINTTSLIDEKFSLENKCKIKVDNQTYVGNVENDSSRLIMLMFENKRPVIKNIALTGDISFRKRIPKAHFMQDNIMANNETDFIPLPDTKCRHPLFGSDYKRAMKIPSMIKTRLKDPYVETPTQTEKKKRTKHSIENTDEVEMETEADQSTRDRKKRRKRKLSGAGDQPDHLKPKRVKSEEAWDSEKAIEEKLFNF